MTEDSKKSPQKSSYEKRKRDGVCIRCGILPPSGGRVKCVSCIALDAERYHKLRESGICTTCGKNPHCENSALCEECAKKKRDRQNLERSKNLNESRELGRTKYDRYKKSGICVRCGLKNDSGRVKCDKCRELDKKVREERKQFGLCIYCGTRQAAEGYTRCEHCASVSRVRGTHYRKTRKDKGACWYCGGQPMDNYYVCENCYYKTVSKSATGKVIIWEGLKEKFKEQNGRCAYSGRLLTLGIDTELDHIVPKSRGGSNNIDNLQWVHVSVNSMKHNLTEEEFLRIVKEIYKFMNLKD